MYNLRLLEKVEHDLDAVIFYFYLFRLLVYVLVQTADVQNLLVVRLKVG